MGSVINVSQIDIAQIVILTPYTIRPDFKSVQYKMSSK